MSGQQHAPAVYFTPGKDPVPIVQEAGWASGPAWTGGKSRPIGIRSPDRPARSSVAVPTELPVPIVTYNYDKFIIIVHSIFNRQLGLYVNMLIALCFLVLSYCHWFYCVVHVVLGVNNELCGVLLCLVLCACPR